MKKLIICITAMLLINAGSYAQASFGVKVGANMANLTGDDVGDMNSLFGAYGGFLANIPLSETFGIQPEVLYSMEGAKYGDFKIQLGYINIPVLMKYSNPSGFFAELGPQIGILVNAKSKDKNDSNDLKEYLKSSNFSVAIGTGYNFTPAIGAGIRYNLGISNIADEGDMKTSTLSLGVHYVFGK